MFISRCNSRPFMHLMATKLVFPRGNDRRHHIHKLSAHVVEKFCKDAWASGCFDR